MQLTTSKHFAPHCASAMRAALTCVAIWALTACGGGGTTSDNGATTASTVSNNNVAQTGLRALPAAMTTRRAISYSPYRTATSVDARANEDITDAMVKQDLDLLVAAGFGLIRLFDSSEKVAYRVLRVITENKLDIKVMLGAYVNSFEYSSSNTAVIQQGNAEELARTIALANAYPDTVVAVSVGNETQVYWSFVQISSQQLASYLKTVRDKIAQPVTTDDNYAVFAGKLPHHPAANNISEVLAQLDFVSLHSYAIEDVLYSNTSDSDAWPDWDARQFSSPNTTQRAAAMMDAAIAKTQKDYALAQSYMASKGKAQLPIIIGETGWKAADSSGSGRYKYLASPVNQKMYLDRLMAWTDSSKAAAGPQNIVYFEAFDEPWKGTDDKWGLFNVNRQARYAIQAKNPASSTWAYEYKTGTTPYTADDAVYYVDAVAKTAVTANRYTVYADTLASGAVRANTLTPDLRWDAFDGSTVTRNEVDVAQGPVDGPNSLSILPNPKNYGWGLLYHSTTDTSDNLSDFAGGSLNFSIQTKYAGKLEIGLSTDTADRTGAEAFVALTDGQYGYCNNGNWCSVSIPFSAFTSASNPTGNSKLDLHYLLSRFIIADRYAKTGNTPQQKTMVYIDNIYWSK